jgi:hypothetical protein
VHLSRPRVILRAALLGAGAGFMFWRALEARRAAATLESGGGDALLFSRLALVFGLVGLLALLAAGMALAALRRRRRPPSLRLGGGPPPPRAS